MRYFVIAAMLFLLLGAGCSPTTTSDSSTTGTRSGVSSLTEQQPDIDALKRWVDSLSGKSIADVRQIFGDSAPIEDTWQHDDEGGKRLEYELPNYDIEFYFSDGSVVLVSIDISSE